jgi:LytS/YehU family sensor histidine kinase
MTFRHALWLFLVFMIGTVYSIQEMLNKNILHQEKIMEEKLKTELQLLKAQINPHFLFNALNNIYSLTYMRSEKAPESVLKLSDMLRYVLDDCSNDSVALSLSLIHISEPTRPY